MKEDSAGGTSPSRIRVWEKVSDVLLTECAQNRVADGVHEHICVRMTVEPFGVRDLNAAKNEFSAFNQSVDVVANANVDHGETIGSAQPGTKGFVESHLPRLRMHLGP